jgi:hypothetical protein
MRYEAIFMSVEFPTGMDMKEVIKRAQTLVPCKVQAGGWEQQDSGESMPYGGKNRKWIVGNMYCESGFYEDNPDGGQYGPDDAGVIVTWETP